MASVFIIAIGIDYTRQYDTVIAVSGGKGFVGSELVKALSESGRVVSISSGNFLEQVGNVVQVGFEHPALASILAPVTIYVHAAGRIKGTYAELEAANVTAVRRYLELLPEGIEQVIHFSSVNAFFPAQSDYGRTKLEGEELWKASPVADRLVVLRPSLIYGPGDERNIYRLIRLIRRFPLLPAPGNGRLRPVYSQDVVDLVTALIRRRECAGTTWVVSGRETTTFKAMIAIIARCLDKRVICVSLPEIMLAALCVLADGLGLRRLAQQVRGFQVDKLWHDPDVWNYLPRETTPLETGLRLSVESFSRSL